MNELNIQNEYGINFIQKGTLMRYSKFHSFSHIYA